MTERPILFSGAMVRALLAGTKTQTRRVVKPQPTGFVGGPGVTNSDGSPAPLVPIDEYFGPCGREIVCPYGQTGDHLWVREAFMHEPADYCWEASVSIPCRPAVTTYRADFPNSQPGEGWKPSIHMPRALSRITLEITGVRVERLQAISESDCWAEGIEEVMHDFDEASQCDMAKRLGCCIEDAKPLYAQLWESINGPGSWEANPWVWVVEFRRLP